MTGRKWALFAIVFAFVLGSLAPEIWAAKGADAGRRHAAKANRLSARNRCKQAIPEFTKAYRLLHDATLLFNRAECYRRLGKSPEAIQDYEGFLAGAPNAPNRAAVEARIASLRASLMPSKGVGEAEVATDVHTRAVPTAEAPARPSKGSKWGDDAFQPASGSVDARSGQ
jgi:tetratricopeptide (TPR) repeat protein